MSNTQNKKNLVDILKAKGLFVPIVIAVAALVLGVLLGANLGGHASNKPVAQAAPQITVTAAPVVKTVKVNTTTVPKACLDALDEADQGFNLAADMSGEFSDAITAIQNSDLDGMNSATDNIKTISGNLGTLADDYNPDKAACRAAAK